MGKPCADRLDAVGDDDLRAAVLVGPRPPATRRGAYQATPQSDDWDAPDMVRLCFGPLGRDHVLAGARGGLYETDPRTTVTTLPSPKLDWRAVELPAGVQTVHRIVAVERSLARW